MGSEMQRKNGPGVPPVETMAQGAENATEMSAATDTFWQSTFEEHASSVLAFLTSRLGRRDQAEDLLQETFVRAIRSRHRLRDASKVRSYLFSTAYRLILNQARGKRQLLFSEMSDEGRRPLEQGLQAETATPEEVVELSRVAERLAQVARGMSPALRRAFEGAVLEQKPYEEIAEENGWTREQVRVNVCRARKRAIAELRDLLKLEGNIS